MKTVLPKSSWARPFLFTPASPTLNYYKQCPNLMNLSRGFNPPKTGFHSAPKIEIEKSNTIFSGTKHISAAA